MIRFDDVLAALPGAQVPAGGWTLGQVLTHCAQSIEFSLSGFPKQKGWLVRSVIGPIVMRRALARGSMSHGLTAEIPGAPALGDPTPEQGMSRLKAAIDAFRAHQGPLAPHFAYGPVSREHYEALHAMHLADHLRPR